MVRSKATTGVDAYFDTLQKIFNLQSEILTGVLPHYGDRGRNDEERFRDFLAKVLPKKYSVGSGFVVCSNPTVPTSSQTDAVIFDEIQNSPLHKELSAFIYPAEIVYATVEVKGVLQRKDLGKIVADIDKIRNLAPHRYYIRYGSAPKTPDQPTQRVVKQQEFSITEPPSRTFVFAYTQKGWSSIDKLVNSLQEALKHTPAHIHGLVVLSEGWYLRQEAFSKTGREFFTFTDNSLLRFVTGMLHSISSLPMPQISIDRYLPDKMRVRP